MKRETIRAAKEHQDRIAIHCDTVINQAQGRAKITQLVDWIGEVITDKGKFGTLCSVLRFPLDTLPLTDEIYECIAKIFDGRNPITKWEFISQEVENDAMNFIKESGLNDFWKTDSLEAAKTAINSIMIVDMPREPKPGLPEPYIYFLDIANAIDWDDKDGEIGDWLIFKAGKDLIGVIEANKYSLYRTKEGVESEIEELLIEEPHELGYTPAKFFFKDYISFRDKAIKKAILTKYLSSLDYMVLWSLAKKTLDLYAGFPPVWTLEQDCKYEDVVRSVKCHNGFLKNDDGIYLMNSRYDGLARCPMCINNRLMGPGAVIEKPIPDEDEKDVGVPIGFVETQVKNLEYVRDELTRLRHEIFTGVVGNAIEPINDQAVNEKQVLAFYEARTQVLNKVKENWEIAEMWGNSTIMKLRYSHNFISYYRNYGTQWFLFSESELLNMYLEARKQHADHGTLDFLQNQYNQTKYKNNPAELEKANILANLDPLRHITPEKATKMFESNQVGFEDYMLKVNMSSLVMRFERDHGNIINFGIEMEMETAEDLFAKRIDLIREILISYIVKPAQPEPQPQPEPIIN